MRCNSNNAFMFEMLIFLCIYFQFSEKSWPRKPAQKRAHFFSCCVYLLGSSVSLTLSAFGYTYTACVYVKHYMLTLFVTSGNINEI